MLSRMRARRLRPSASPEVRRIFSGSIRDQKIHEVNPQAKIRLDTSTYIEPVSWEFEPSL